MSAVSPGADSWGEDDNARRYDAYTRVHPMYRDLSRDLISLAGLSADAAVVDLACGTGVTSRQILAVLGPGGSLAGVDKSAAMLAVAARSVADPRASWIEARAESVDVYVAGLVDAVVCNSAIWQADLAATVAAVRNVLTAGGRFVFNVGFDHLAEQDDPSFPGDRPSPISVMKAIAAGDYGWRPPDAAGAGSRRSRLSRESICRCLDAAGFEIERVAEFGYEEDAESERAWLSVPIFTKYQFPGLSYEDRMRVLAKAYMLLGPRKAELSRWVAFAARLEESESEGELGSPALLRGLAGDAKPGIDLSPGVAAGARALDRLGYGGVEVIREPGHEDESLDVAVCGTA
jgi:SAM-dependent methyltransferase